MKSIFSFLKNIVHFFKIVILFIILTLILYWIQNLAHFNWNFLNFINPVLKNLLAIGHIFTPGKMEIFDTIFEFKYITTVCILLICYTIVHFIYIGLEKLEELIDDTKRAVNKINENIYNKTMELNAVSEQKKMQIYQIYVTASLKKKFSHKELNINLEEQLQLMNEFLIDKTGVQPQEFEDGFLYNFSRFDEIDSVLENFFKLIHSKAPLDYIICIQIFDTNAQYSLQKLIKLRMSNKIVMCADTMYRYKFNKSHRYGTSQLGLYQNENNTYEVHEFIEI